MTPDNTNSLVRQAELLILGAILDDNANYDKFVSDYGLREFFFYTEASKLCFRAIDVILANKNYADVISIAKHIENLGYTDIDKLTTFLMSVAENTERLSNYENCVNLLKSASIKREIRIKTEELKTFADKNNSSVEDVLEHAEKVFFDLGELHNSKHKEQTSANLAEQVETYLREKQASPDKFVGTSTGFRKLDDITGGLNNGELIVLAARPSMGKTSLAMNIANNIAISLSGNKENVLLFSMEMSARDIMMRILSSLTRLNLKKLMTADLYDNDWTNINSSLRIIKESNLLIDDASSLSPLDIRSKAREIKRKYGLKLIVIDYLQLISADGNIENRNLEISSISRSLKALARELDVPVIVLSQLNRSLESRLNKRPILSDLRESGAIEQDADLVMAIYRDEVYNENSEQRGIAEILLLKHRNGPIGTIKLHFHKESASFEELSFEDENAFH